MCKISQWSLHCNLDDSRLQFQWNLNCYGKVICEMNLGPFNAKVYVIYLILRYELVTTSMMMSSNGNIFRITGHLWGEFNGHRWIPRIPRYFFCETAMVFSGAITHPRGLTTLNIDVRPGINNYIIYVYMDVIAYPQLNPLLVYITCQWKRS